MSHPPLPIGQLLGPEVQRDCVHMALAPVFAAHRLSPGTHVGLDSDGRASANAAPIGIIDPFLEGVVRPGQRVFLFLYPGSITSLRHDFTHPAFKDTALVEPAPAVSPKSASEVWMRAWAVRHMASDYYGDEEPVSEDVAYDRAIEAGHRMCVGPYESARDHIDNTWWDHWERITGCKGERGDYFSCAC